jgi:hypothetical protein
MLVMVSVMVSFDARIRLNTTVVKVVEVVGVGAARTEHPRRQPGDMPQRHELTHASPHLVPTESNARLKENASWRRATNAHEATVIHSRQNLGLGFTFHSNM